MALAQNWKLSGTVEELLGIKVIWGTVEAKLIGERLWHSWGAAGAQFQDIYKIQSEKI